MKLLLKTISIIARAIYKSLSLIVDEKKLDQIKVLHWCEKYHAYGLKKPPFVGMAFTPEASTIGSSNLTYISADLEGEVTDDGNDDITERGFYWMQGSGDPGETDNVLSETGTFGEGTYTLKLENLSQSTTYSFKAFATNSEGTATGSAMEFTTPEEPSDVIYLPEQYQFEQGRNRLLAEGDQLTEGEDSVILDTRVAPEYSQEPVKLLAEVIKSSESFTGTATHTGNDIHPDPADLPNLAGHIISYDPVQKRLLVFGGRDWDGNHRNGVWEIRYDKNAAPKPQVKQLSPGGTLPTVRRLHGACFDKTNNRLIITGGYNDETSFGDTWALDFSNSEDGEWSKIIDQYPFHSGGMTNIGQAVVYDESRGCAYILGGWADNEGEAFVQKLDLTVGSEAWTTLITTDNASHPGTRDHIVVYDEANDRLIAQGGQVGGDFTSGGRNEFWEFDLSTNTYTQLAPSGDSVPGTARHGAVYDSVNQRVVTFAGIQGGTSASDGTNYLYELTLPSDSDGTFTDSTPSNDYNVGRRHAALAAKVTDSNDMIVFGGIRYGGGRVRTLLAIDLDKTLMPAGVDLNRCVSEVDAQAYAFDTDHNYLLSLGGTGRNKDDTLDSAEQINDAWLYNVANNEWHRPIVKNIGTLPCEGSTAVYDSTNQRFIVFGGFDGNSVPEYLNNAVYALNYVGKGIFEAERLAPGGTIPLPRWLCAMVYDPVNERVIMYGGETIHGNQDDVWELDFSNDLQGYWSQLSPSGTTLSERRQPGYCYDSKNHRMLFFGGEAGGTYYNDTVALNLTKGSEEWVSLNPSTSPSERRGCGFRYDANNERAIMFGGYEALSDLWVLDTSTPGSETWTEITGLDPAPSGRRSFASGIDPTAQAFVIYGGRGASAPPFFDDTWKLDIPTDTANWAWTEITPKISLVHSILVTGLADGEYRWQSWADGMSVTSPKEYETAGTTDFVVGSTPGTEVTSERDFELTGQNSAVSDRGVEISGKSTANSEQNWEISGGQPANSDRDFETTGQDIANNERGLEISGQEIVNSERNIETHGQEGVASSRDFEISGIDTANNERGFEITGKDKASSERAWEIDGESGAISTNSDRDFETTGQDSANSEHSWELRGKDTSNSEQGLELTGQDSGASERGIETTGQDTSTSERGWAIYGQEQATAERDFNLTGKESSQTDRDWEMETQAEVGSERSWEILVEESFGTERSFETAGIDTTQTERGLELTGKKQTTSEQDWEIDAQGKSNTEREVEVSGQDQSNSDRNFEIPGEDYDNTERPFEITGREKSVSGRDIELSGQAQNNSERDIELIGKDTGSLEANFEVTGKKSDQDERSWEIDAKGKVGSSRNWEALVEGGFGTERGFELAGIDTTQTERPWEVTGSLDENTERGFETEGQDSNQSERDIELTGSKEAHGERGIEISGKDQAISDRDWEVPGQDHATSERNIETTGSLKEASEKDIEISGQDQVGTDRNIELVGKGEAQTERGFEVKVDNEAQTDRSWEILVEEGFGTERSLEIAGQDTNQTDRDIELTGKTGQDSSRGFEIIGSLVADSDRDLETLSQDTFQTERGLEIGGGIKTDSDRNIETSGQSIKGSEREISITGQDTAQDDRELELRGEQGDNTQREIMLRGEAHTNAQRTLEMVGGSKNITEGNFEINGQEEAGTERGWELMVNYVKGCSPQPPQYSAKEKPYSYKSNWENKPSC